MEVASVDRNIRRPIMKWQGYNSSAGKKVNGIFAKLSKHKSIYYLLMIASLGLALGASWKWHP